MNPFGLFGGERYTLPSHKKPSLRNIEAGIGLFGGMYAGLLLSGPVSIVPISMAALGMTIGGALLGGTIGRVRMERELKQGREIHSPSMFNKTWIAGTLVGLCASALLVPTLLGAFPLIGAIAGISLVVGGSLIGGLSEYFKQKDDFARAKERHEIEQMKQSEKERHPPALSNGRSASPALPEPENAPGGWSQRNPPAAGARPAVREKPLDSRVHSQTTADTEKGMGRG